MRDEDIVVALNASIASLGPVDPPCPLRPGEPINERDLWQQVNDRLILSCMQVIQHDRYHDVGVVWAEGQPVGGLEYNTTRQEITWEPNGRLGGRQWWSVGTTTGVR